MSHDNNKCNDETFSFTSSNASSLVANATCGTISAQYYLHKEDTLLQLLLAKFSNGLTRYQRSEFCEILNLI